MAAIKEIVGGLQTTLGRMEIALGAIHEAIVWTTKTGTIIWCNKFFDTMLGLPHIALLGADVFEVFPLENQHGPISIRQHPCKKLQQKAMKMHLIKSISNLR